MGAPLKNPPVYLTLVQVKFNPILKLDDYIASIQELFRRSGYPDFKQKTDLELRINLVGGQPKPEPTAHPKFLFGDETGKDQFSLTRDALTLQSVNYGHYEDFSRRFEQGLEHIHEIVNLSYIQRVGLRYLDHIAPLAPNDELEQYLVAGAFGLSTCVKGIQEYGYTEILSRIGNVKLRARIFVRKAPLGFPPDIGNIELQIQERFKKTSHRHAVLDTDGFAEDRETYTIGTVRTRLRQIHDVIGAAFQNITTPHAREMWNK